jgi:hypothetical protein
MIGFADLGMRLYFNVNRLLNLTAGLVLASGIVRSIKRRVMQALEQRKKLSKGIGIIINVAPRPIPRLKEAHAISSKDIEHPIILYTAQLERLALTVLELSYAVINDEIAIYALRIEKLLISRHACKTNVRLFDWEAEE